MTLGPFLIREFRISSRRRGTFVGRATSAGLVLAIIGGMTLGWDLAGWERSSVRGMTQFTFRMFATIVYIQIFGALGGLPPLVAPRIAGERERKTLDALLASSLSSAEIVLGTTAEGVAGYLSGLVVVFPIVLLMVPLGGVDPRLVLLAFASLLSISFFLAALSAALSAGARNRRAVLAWATALAMAWAILPVLAVVLLPRIWSAAARSTTPVALVLLDSSPIGVVANLAGAVRRCGPLESVLRMIALQVIGGALLLGFAVLRLRPASRAAHDDESRTAWLLQTDRSRRQRWPSCGDDPVFWRERHSRPAATRLGRIIGSLVGLGFLGCLVAGTFWFARPAFQELFERGYGAAAGVTIADLSTLALAVPGGWYGSTPTGQARVEFNAVLRQFTVFWDLLYVLNLAGFAAVGIARERAQDTWSGLLATALSASEIVRAKMLGAAWRMRVGALVLVVLWTVGLVAGAVHPLGYALAIAGLGVSSWFLVALGTAISLRSTDVNQASNRVTKIVGILIFSALLPAIMPPLGRPASIMMGATSAPMHAGLLLFSYEDIREAARSGAFPALGVLGLNTGEGVWVVLATCLIGLAGQAIAAHLLTRAAIAGFDEHVGRPNRSQQPPAGPGSLPGRSPMAMMVPLAGALPPANVSRGDHR